jgi:hypothetical protein
MSAHFFLTVHGRIGEGGWMQTEQTQMDTLSTGPLDQNMLW